VHWHKEVVKVALALLQGGWVAEGALVVWHWPLGSAHHTQIVVAVWVYRAQEGILGGEASSGSN